MQVELTIHAIERFQERIAPHASFKSAKKQLLAATQRATPLKEQTVRGHDLWTVNDPSMRLVIKVDKRSHVCVTVLSPKEYMQNGLNKQQELLDSYAAKEEVKQKELIQIEEYLQTAKSQEQIHLAQKREILALEHDILSLELATIRSREESLKHQIDTKSDQEIHKRALRFALRAIYGELSFAEALSQISSLDERLLNSTFYKAKLAKVCEELALAS